jgi:hypothetical protein
MKNPGFSKNIASSNLLNPRFLVEFPAGPPGIENERMSAFNKISTITGKIVLLYQLIV